MEALYSFESLCTLLHVDAVQMPIILTQVK
jgi:hypothetical protein